MGGIAAAHKCVIGSLSKVADGVQQRPVEVENDKFLLLHQLLRISFFHCFTHVNHSSALWKLPSHSSAAEQKAR